MALTDLFKSKKHDEPSDDPFGNRAAQEAYERMKLQWEKDQHQQAAAKAPRPGQIIPFPMKSSPGYAGYLAGMGFTASPVVPVELPEDTKAEDLFKELTEHPRYGKAMKRVLAEIAAAQKPREFTEQELRILDSIKTAMAEQKGSVINIPIPRPVMARSFGPDDPIAPL